MLRMAIFPVGLIILAVVAVLVVGLVLALTKK